MEYIADGYGVLCLGGSSSQCSPSAFDSRALLSFQCCDLSLLKKQSSEDIKSVFVLWEEIRINACSSPGSLQVLIWNEWSSPFFFLDFET